MKKCKTCEVELTEENIVQGRNWCKNCRKSYMKKYNARPERVEDRKQRKPLDRLNTRKWLDELKKSPCVDCGIQYPPYVMDFHHINGDKDGGVGIIVWRKGRKAALEEIKKCILLCSNCHRIRHHEISS